MVPFWLLTAPAPPSLSVYTVVPTVSYTFCKVSFSPALRAFPGLSTQEKRRGLALEAMLEVRQFANLSLANVVRQICKVAKTLKLRLYFPKMRICRQGEENSTFMCFVHQGTLEVLANGAPVGALSVTESAIALAVTFVSKKVITGKHANFGSSRVGC